MLFKKIFLAIIVLYSGTIGAITIDSFVLKGQASGQITGALLGNTGYIPEDFKSLNIPLHPGTNKLDLETKGGERDGSPKDEIEFTIDGIGYLLKSNIYPQPSKGTIESRFTILMKKKYEYNYYITLSEIYEKRYVDDINSSSIYQIEYNAESAPRNVYGMPYNIFSIKKLTPEEAAQTRTVTQEQ